MDSILNSIKQYLGISLDCLDFDEDICMNINAAFATFDQVGISGLPTVTISETPFNWNDLELPPQTINLLKPATLIKVRLLFDPPENGILLENLNKQFAEYLWRLQSTLSMKDD